LVGLPVVLWHVEKLCFIHRFAAGNSLSQFEHSIRSLRNHSCPEKPSKICIKQCFSSPVMFALSPLRVLHIAPASSRFRTIIACS
jgi:hypothetical protein